VTTHESWLTPPSSAVMVGSAVATIVESSAARSTASMSAPKTTKTSRRGRTIGPGSAAASADMRTG
jgi:hypothetical protein